MEPIERKFCTLDDAVAIYPASKWFDDANEKSATSSPYIFIESNLEIQTYFIPVINSRTYVSGIILMPNPNIEPLYVSLILNSSYVRTLLSTFSNKRISISPNKLKKLPFICIDEGLQYMLGLIHQCSQVLLTSQLREKDPFYLHKTRTFQDLRDAICHELFEPNLYLSYHFDIITDWAIFLKQYLIQNKDENDGITLDLVNACYTHMMNPLSDLTRDIKRMQYFLGNSF